DVAERPAEDERHAQALHEQRTAFRHHMQAVADADHGDDAEERKQKLPPFAAELHAEGHSSVLDEMEIAPVAEKRDGAIVEESEFHPELQYLIGDQYQKDHGENALHRGQIGSRPFSRSSAAWPRCS